MIALGSLHSICLLNDKGTQTPARLCHQVIGPGTIFCLHCARFNGDTRELTIIRYVIVPTSCIVTSPGALSGLLVNQKVLDGTLVVTSTPIMRATFFSEVRPIVRTSPWSRYWCSLHRFRAIDQLVVVTYKNRT